MPAKTFRMGPIYRPANSVIGLLARLGLLRHTYLLQVTGARTGRRRSVPVTLVENGERWLVAPYGERGWVRNVRARPAGRLVRGLRAADVRFEEVGPDEAAPVLRRYWQDVALTRPYFDVGPEPDVEDFRRVAARHPVFRVVG
jgi:deazaflavin-dependent oxidoreductase (nitroreductase family)